MINSVRNTVLAVANKQNFGFITPSDFNLYSKMSQLDIFEDIFYKYNQWVYKQNQRASGSDYADIVQNIEEVIDRFSVINSSLDDSNGPVFPLPADYSFINSIYCNGVFAERVSNGNTLTRLMNSNLTTPKASKPVYTVNGTDINVYPATITTGVTCNYVRKPLDPNWTYRTLFGGEPLFDQSSVSYQDFELPERYAPALCIKILQYAGVEIRDEDVIKVYQNEENVEAQKKQ